MAIIFVELYKLYPWLWAFYLNNNLNMKKVYLILFHYTL